jgi:hypothetical protein
MLRFKEYLIEIANKNSFPQTTLIPASTTGKAQFRVEDGDWQDVGANVPVGSETRTGLNSSITLNLNSDEEATQSSGTMRKVPSSEENSEEFIKPINTTTGESDFKVDKVGLSNDFKISKPSKTLGIRG